MNSEIFKAIAEVKEELNHLRTTHAPRATQVECFTRLIALYGALNLQQSSEDEQKKAG